MNLDFSEVFRKTTPAFEGETEEDFYWFIQENLSSWEAEEFIGRSVG